MNSPAELMRYRRHVHERTARVVATIPHADFDWAPSAGQFSFADQVRHLANIERWMYCETLSGKPSRYQGHGKAYADGPIAVLDYYHRLHEESGRVLEAIPHNAFNRKVFTPAGTPITLWKWFRSMFEHEAHHRGQIYCMLGMRGVRTPTLYGLTSEEVAAKSLPLPG